LAAGRIKGINQAEIIDAADLMDVSASPKAMLFVGAPLCPLISLKMQLNFMPS
jgi:hypothetical protein